MHYGTPATTEAILPYYTHIRRGHPPSPEQLADLTARYEAIGGPSPLTEISEKQARRLQAALAEEGIEVRLFIGTKHAPPFVGDAVAAMAEAGMEEAVGVVLAPHYSAASVRLYQNAAEAAREACAAPLTLHYLDRWGTLPELVEALALRVEERLEGWDPQETCVLFTAHSLPQRVVAQGDPYEEELLETSRLVGERLGLPHFRFCYQSASQTGEPWLGPDILDVLDELAASGRKRVLACTVGFVSDHLEVRYDLGIEARERANELGIEYRLARCIDDDPGVLRALGKRLAALYGLPV